MLAVRSNYAAAVAHRNLSASDELVTRSMTRLSSGYRTALTRDDPVGLALGTRMRSNVLALDQAYRNVAQATSMLQVAEGGMSVITDLLVRARTLAVQAASDNIANPERSMLQEEFSLIQQEIDRVARSTNYDGHALLIGTPGILASSTNVATPDPTFAAGPTEDVANVVAVAQVEAFNPDTVEVDDVFSVNINGTIVSFTATTTSGSDISTGLKAAIDGDATLGALVDTSVDSDGHLLVTAKTAGTPFTFSASATDGGGADTQTIASVAAKRVTNVVAVAQVTHLKPTALGPGSELSAIVNGATFTVTAADTTTQPADALDDLVAAINAGQADVVASTDGIELTLTAATAGTSFTASGTAAKTAASTQVSTLTLAGTPQPGNRYTLDVDGQKLTVIVGNEATVEDVAKTIAARFNASPNTTFQGITASADGNMVVLSASEDRGAFVPKIDTIAPPASTESAQFRMRFQVGINPKPVESIEVEIDSVTARALGVDADSVDIMSLDNAVEAITAVRAAIDNVAYYRARIGASQNRLQSASDAVTIERDNEEAARSSIMDLDIAAEMSRLVSAQVLRDLGVSMMTQANRIPQSLMKLFEG